MLLKVLLFLLFLRMSQVQQLSYSKTFKKIIMLLKLRIWLCLVNCLVLKS
ncbi:Uncharacterised protein [Pseudomonas putida]|nr:Uncharacterised protein [Pseudomonas putida]